MRVIWCVRALCLAPVLLSVESPAPSMGLLGHFLELSRRGFDLPLGSPRHGRERCVSSTSATYLGHEHPHVVRLSSAHALPLHATTCPDARSERATPGSLAGAQPRVPVRLTPHRRLRHLPSTTRLASRVSSFERGTSPLARPNGRGVFDRVPGWGPASGACCPTGTAPLGVRAMREPGGEDRFPRAHVNEHGFFGPKRLPPTGAPA